MRRLLPLALLGCSVNWCDWISMEKVQSMVRDRFPDVAQISTQDFAEMAKADSADGFDLVDVRDPQEFAVSHLANAVPVHAWTAPNDKTRRIIVYCSVGYRSSEFAHSLIQQGYRNVVNIEGSLFKWANEGRMIINDDGVAHRVHPYDTQWGCLLRDDLVADTDD